MAVGAKIYNRMLLDRLRPHIDPKLRNNQNGFRKGRFTVAQTLTFVDWQRELSRKTSKLLSLSLISVRRSIQSTGGNLWKY